MAPKLEKNMRVRNKQSKGVVLLVTLCGITLLVAIVFLVYNVSDQVNRKIELQSSADSAAISAGGWYARSMNLISQNNCNQARLLALVSVMDALPLAAEMTEIELKNLDEALENSIGENQQKLPDDKYEKVGSGRSTNFIKTGFKKIQERIKYQQQLAAELDSKIDCDDELNKEGGVDLSKITHWSQQSSSSDSFWAAIVAMDAQSQAAVTKIDSLAQNSAYRFARKNNSDSGFAIPIGLPEFKQTEFSDFYPVMRDSFKLTWKKDEGTEVAPSFHQSDFEYRIETSVDPLLDLEWGRISLHTGGAIVDPDFDYQTRLGPFLKLHRWTHVAYQAKRSDSNQPERYGAMDPEIGQDFDNQPKRDEIIKITWTTYGPFQWALYKTAHAFEQNFNQSRFDQIQYRRRNYNHHLEKVATHKIAWMFEIDREMKVHYPQKWIHDYTSARIFANDPENRAKIMRTRIYRIAVMSSVSWNDPDWLMDESTFFTYEDINPTTDPPAIHWYFDHQGWYDIANTVNGRGTVSAFDDRERIDENIWRWARQRETTYDPRIGIKKTYDANGNLIAQPVYYCSWYIFGGIDIRDEEIDISNPYDWTDSEKENRPRPILLDVEKLSKPDTVNFVQARKDPTTEAWYEMDIDGSKLQPYSLVGVSRASNKAVVWSQRFNSANPDNHMTALARVNIFNNKSWDMWTQDWRVQLVPLLNDTAEADSLKTWSQLSQLAETAVDTIESYPDTEVPLSLTQDVMKYIESLDTDGNTDEFVNH